MDPELLPETELRPLVGPRARLPELTFRVSVSRVLEPAAASERVMASPLAVEKRRVESSLTSIVDGPVMPGGVDVVVV